MLTTIQFIPSPATHHALRSIAETRGRTVLLSIHQLGAHIDKMFDSIILLAAGSVLHHGIVDQLESELHALRMPRPSAGIVLVLLPTALTPSLLNSSKQAIIQASVAISPSIGPGGADLGAGAGRSLGLEGVARSPRRRSATLRGRGVGRMQQAGERRGGRPRQEATSGAGRPPLPL